MVSWSNLREDYERLGSFKAVAKEYGVAPETVSRKAKELGVNSKRRQRKLDLDPQELRRLYDNGISVPDLADQFDSSQSTIYLRLWMAGTEMRRSGHTGWSWGPEQYEKRRKAVERGAFRGAQRERFRRLGRETPKMNSPHERLFQQELIKASLSFETQPRILRFYPDFHLKQKSIIVELDSWGHQLPHVVEFDNKRDEELTNAGFSVVRFNNEQIDTDASALVRWLVRQFDLKPETNPTVYIRERRGGKSIFTNKSDGDRV